MKKLCLILAYLFLFTQTASAMPLLVGQKVVYRGKITGLRISAVNGTAFIDNLPYTYSSDFSATSDGFSASKGTASGNIDSIGGEDNWLRLTLSNENGSHFLYKNLLFAAGKKATINLKYYIPSTNSNIDGIKCGDSGSSLSGLFNTLDTVSNASFTLTATETGMRVYARDGTASEFTDAEGDDVLYVKDITISLITALADGSHYIEIYDANGNFLRGVLKSQGTGETLDSELVTNGDFETDDIGKSGWNPYTGTDTAALDGSIKHGGSYSLHIAESNNTFPAGVRRAMTGKVQYALYKSTFWYNVVSPESGTGGLRCIVYDNAWSGQIISSSKYKSTSGTWMQSVTYGTETVSGSNGGTSFVNDSDSIAGEFYIDDHSVKKVLTPSIAGCRIVSLKAGTTYNFSYRSASFIHGQESYYVIIRAIR